MGGPLVAGAAAGAGAGGAAASEEADLETELGVCAKAATGGGKHQSNSEKEPPQHPIDT